MREIGRHLRLVDDDDDEEESPGLPGRVIPVTEILAL